MRKYEKPIVSINEGLAEGVYAASGDACYISTTAKHVQSIAGENKHIYQVDAIHDPEDNHHSQGQVFVVTFDRPVTYVSSDGILISGDGTETLSIQFNYHNNANSGSNIGFGNLTVCAEVQPVVVSAEFSSCSLCTSHTW